MATLMQLALIDDLPIVARPPQPRPAPRRATLTARSVQIGLDPAVLDPEEHARLSRRKIRTCMWCGTGFDSDHAGHRKCDPCREKGDASASPIDAVIALAGF